MSKNLQHPLFLLTVFVFAIFVLGFFYRENKKEAAAQSGFDCATIRANNPGVVFCEDFEDPNLNKDGTGGWATLYPGIVNGCFLSNGIPDDGIEGTCPTCCVNVVKEGECEAMGETDCVAAGNQALGHRYRPGQEGGIVGEKGFATGANFGVTALVKWSPNFIMGSGPKKTDEFGGTNSCIFGCSSGTYVGGTEYMPFHGNLWWKTGASWPSGYTEVKGKLGYNVALGWWPNASDYQWNPANQDKWQCWQVHFTNYGQQNARIRHWVNGNLLVDIQNVDLRNANDSVIDHISFNNYYNGAYPGSSVAYRYEDNVVVTTAGEPVSCASVGYTGATPPPSNFPPTVSLSVSPTSITSGGSATFLAAASDSDGSISSVEFYVNGNSQAIDTSYPYSLSYSPLSPGTYTITAVATDNNGATGSSNAATLTVNPANLCGNNTIDGTEQCDGTNLNGKTCSSLNQGFTGGTLSCSSCYFVTSSCTLPAGGPPPSGGLIGEWKMNEGSGTTISDSSGANLSGAITGATWTTGHEGSALSFNGASNYLSLGEAFNTLSTPFSFSAWIKTDGSYSGDPVIFASDDETTYTGWKVYLEGLNVNHLGLDFMDGGGTGSSHRRTYQTTNAIPVTLSSWTHIAVVANSESSVSMYINGTSTPVYFDSGTGGNMVHKTANTPARIGRRENNYWKGAIDDIKIYNKALSSSEVQALYNPTPPPASLSNLSFSVSTDTNLSLSGKTLTLSILPQNSTSNTTPLYTQSQTASGLNQITLSSTNCSPSACPPNTYDIRIKAPNTLSKKQTFTLSSNQTFTFQNKLISGDINNDNAINSLDWSLMSPDWFQTNKTSDINGDGITNALDFTWLNRNWFLVGE